MSAEAYDDDRDYVSFLSDMCQLAREHADTRQARASACEGKGAREAARLLRAEARAYDRVAELIEQDLVQRAAGR